MGFDHPTANRLRQWPDIHKSTALGVTGASWALMGFNPVMVQIWIGEGNRRWLEAHYFKYQGGPLGNLQVIIPAGPDDPDQLLDACIAFFPEAFTACPSLAAVRHELRETIRLDFNLSPEAVPKLWSTLREEARPIFGNLILYRADLVEVPQGTRTGTP